MKKEATKTAAKKTTATKSEPKKAPKAAAKKAAEPKAEAKVEAAVAAAVEVKAPKATKAPKAAKQSAPAPEQSLPRPASVRLDWELAAAWEVVRVVERGEPLRDGAMAEHFEAVVSPHLRNFIQYGQSSLNQYETDKLVEGLLRQSAEGLSGEYLAGDRVRFSLDGEESQGFVYGSDGKGLCILAVDAQGGDFVGVSAGEGKGQARVLAVVASAA